MHVNADFSRRAVVAADQYQWITSPQGGVERVMLDRLGGETARATSIVRYASASSFPLHQHPGGEEILVLSGTFSEGNQHYPAGWYLRNPTGSSHQPSSDGGAIIFVKLGQMPPEEDRSVRIDTRNPSRWERRAGREVCPLFADASEQTVLVRLDRDEPLFANAVNSAELLVLAGELWTDGRQYVRGSWLRLPAGEYPDYVAGPHGAALYLKTGHFAGLTTCR
ncbi:cupin domain-containing protein [Paraburkholderia diazotrophica]|uniref:Anti-ECFsigma factor, ChrR n=1 Tax=Paraburkholderia diazotrophica TaxID=667676 RepID=A0A1H7EM91_9BURK|nr:cupin domain-containing protein [Paraburkholderia diazotrophica]SEK14187.1 anti-ECFsigma factor, ChrR [Paraburkholderia diazotrophica]